MKVWAVMHGTTVKGLYATEDLARTALAVFNDVYVIGKRFIVVEMIVHDK